MRPLPASLSGSIMLGVLDLGWCLRCSHFSSCFPRDVLDVCVGSCITLNEYIGNDMTRVLRALNMFTTEFGLAYFVDTRELLFCEAFLYRRILLVLHPLI